VAKEPAKAQGPDDTWVQWIERIAQGDQAALGHFYDATSRLVYGLALRILGNSGIAQDVTLEVYLQVWRQAGSFDPARGKVLTWLMTIARSRAIDHLRATPQQIANPEPLETLKEVKSPSPDPEASAVLAQRSAQVRRALETLSPDQRRAIELAFFAGLSQSEIALKLNEPLGTIKTRVRSGMLRLREILQPYEGDIA
jgi:RNA polymerase sigma-70 factor (ECF subfamily)